MYGDNKAITGGLAIRYNNVLTLELRKGSINAQHPLHACKDQYMLIKTKVTKNHCMTTRNPYVTVEYAVKLGQGTDNTLEIIDLAIENGVVIKTGAWIREYEIGKPHEKGNERVLPDGTKAAWNNQCSLCNVNCIE